MGLWDLIYLFAIGVAGGIVTSIVGGASLVTFPALIAIGLPPVPAVIVNLVALTPANIAAAWWDRSQFPPFGKDLLIVCAVSCVGSLFGAWLLLITPARVFEALIPLLLGLATALFAYAGHIAHWIEKRSATAAAAERSRWNMTIAAMVPVSIYGGYFGAGNGVMLLAILMIVAGGDYRMANAIKNMLAGINSLMASAVYAAKGVVLWPPVLVITAGALLGAMIGMKIVRIVPREAMRRGVIAISALLTLVFAWRYWL